MKNDVLEELLDCFVDSDFEDNFRECLFYLDMHFGYDKIGYCEWGQHYELNEFLKNGPINICKECFDNI